MNSQKTNKNHLQGIIRRASVLKFEERTVPIPVVYTFHDEASFKVVSKYDQQIIALIEDAFH